MLFGWIPFSSQALMYLCNLLNIVILHSLILGLQWRHKKLKLTTSLTKCLNNVHNIVLKGLCKFQVDRPTNARVITVQSFGKSPNIYIAAAKLVGKKILQLPWPIVLFSLVQIASNLVQRHVVWSYRPYLNLRQIYRNLHDHIFDDVICKPPIDSVFN